jgi:hypothetical protein
MKRQVRKGFFIRPEASVLSWEFRCAYGLYLSPLSLALSREGRGDVLFECIANVQSGRKYKLSG